MHTLLIFFKSAIIGKSIEHIETGKLLKPSEKQDVTYAISAFMIKVTGRWFCFHHKIVSILHIRKIQWLVPKLYFHDAY